MRDAMRELDAGKARACWAEARPGMPQPRSDADALTMLHIARTQSPLMTLRERAYSHRWCLDNGMPSALPDKLKPKAERLYPVLTEAVGISVNGSGLFAPIRSLVRESMEHAVEECFADGHKETEIVRPRMMEAKTRAVRQLLGIR
jgi:hypothetical protein